MDEKHPDIGTEIREKKTIDDVLKQKLEEAIREFKAGFCAKK
jgi:F0F1-type ATP synthase alpha subunit